MRKRNLERKRSSAKRKQNRKLARTSDGYMPAAKFYFNIAKGMPTARRDYGTAAQDN